MNPDIPLILFAKAPVPGQVKTRLQSHCSPEQAAGIAGVLMQETIRNACRNWAGSVYLSVWLQHDHPFFNAMQQTYPIRMAQQCAGNLGEKMQFDLQRFGYPAAILGCDAPHITGADLQRTHQSLSQGQSVIGPSLDGGYYLIGLAEPADVLFHNIDWGTPGVLSATYAAASAMNLELLELSPLNDVDEWHDLLVAADRLPPLSRYLVEQGLMT